MRNSRISEHIEKILQNLPKSPWVYQMKDKGGKVIYVWKAKSLKSRVNSYFLQNAELTMAKRHMVDKITDIEILLCSTEVEALVLETNIIKHLSPKYNILMKDDKNLAYIKITNSSVPELIKTRQKIRDGGEYFGPYVSSVEQSVRSLRKIFKIRNCRIKFSWDWGRLAILDKAGKTIPCMDYYIWLCPGPCLLGSQNTESHASNISQVRSFLSWDTHSIFMDLQEQMYKKAKNFEFEEAQKIKETLEALQSLSEKQKVRDIVDGNIDILIKYEKYEKIYLAFTQVRKSQIIWVFRHEVSWFSDDDIIVQFLTRQYLDNDDTPDILLLKESLWDAAFIEFLWDKNIRIEYPKIGPKNDLIEFSFNQIREYAYKKELATLENKTLTREHMVNVLRHIGYIFPKKGEIVFECYDISHTDWHFTYASRVLITNGKPDPSRYKKYKIKTLQDGDIDDFTSHKEVMYRRTLEWLEQDNFPQLIIIDWWKWQLSSALAWIREWIYSFLSSKDDKWEITPQIIDWYMPQICSIAKREEEIFIPGSKEAILFDKGTPEMMVLQKARDESHRFSITANKSARMKSMKKNILEELPWFGPVTRKKLLKIAGNIEEIKNLSLEELKTICTTSQIETLRDHGFFQN
jgi:excinuclease ABC subunit C